MHRVRQLVLKHVWKSSPHVGCRLVSSKGILCPDFRPSLLTVHWSSERVTLSVYCTVILHVWYSCCSTQITKHGQIVCSLTTTNGTFDLNMRSKQPIESCVVVCSALLREDFAQLQASKPLSSWEDVTILQLKYKHFIAMETAPLTPPPTHTSTHPHTHTHPRTYSLTAG